MRFIADGTNGVSTEALTGLRNLSRRQASSEHMPAQGNGMDFSALWDLILAATPALCDGTRHFLQQETAALKVPDPGARDQDVRIR